MGDIVVIGAGQAGASLAARLRAQGFDGGLTLIGAEATPPYQRPPLSKAYLLGEMEVDRLYLRSKGFYADNAIDLRLGATVSAIDRSAQVVHLGDGTEVPYGQAALTLGAAPKRLPAAIGGDLDGVFTVRTLTDVDAMAPRIRQGGRLVVVGGGYIGLEAAAVARKCGLEVTIIEAAARILSRVAAPETADRFRALHRDHGVTVVEGAGLERLTGDGAVTGAELTDGTHIPADIVVTGIGIAPVTDLADAAGLKIDNGIAVSALGQTSDPAIWAAGDCASFPHGDGRLRLESVQNAIDQAESVADNMLGGTTPYTPVPWFWSDQYDVKLQIAGLNTGHDRVVVREGARARSASHWYYAGDRLLAVDAMNDPRAYMVGKRLIEAGTSPDPDTIADPKADLKALMR